MTKKEAPEKESIYRVSFISEGELCEIFALGIANSNLFGFLEVDELVWGSNSSIVIDPSEERLRNKFKDVTCLFIPLHTVDNIAIVEKDKMGSAKIVPIKEGSNIMRFPAPIYTPTTSE
jgi:hypothetical protein